LPNVLATPHDVVIIADLPEASTVRAFEVIAGSLLEVADKVLKR
jgi:hypothetical protein